MTNLADNPNELQVKHMNTSDATDDCTGRPRSMSVESRGEAKDLQGVPVGEVGERNAAGWRESSPSSETGTTPSSNGGAAAASSAEQTPLLVVPTAFPDLLDALRSDESRAVVATEAVPPFKIALVNHAWENLCGYKSSEVVGKTMGSLIQGPKTDHAALRKFEAELSAGDTLAKAKTVNYRKDGSTFPNEVHAAPLVNADGTVQYFVAVLRDLSEWLDDEVEGKATAGTRDGDKKAKAVCVSPSQNKDAVEIVDSSSTESESGDDSVRDTTRKHDSPPENNEVLSCQRVCFDEDAFEDDGPVDDTRQTMVTSNAGDVESKWNTSNKKKRPKNYRRSSLADIGRRLAQGRGFSRHESLQSLDSVLSSSSAANKHWCWGRRGEGNDADGCMDKCWSTWKRQHFKPAIPTSEAELAQVQELRGEGSWQLKAVKWLNSHWVQKVLLSLLLCDVLILFIELYLDVAFPSCTTITRDAISCCPADCGSSAHQDDYSDGKDYDNDGDDEHHLLRFLGGGGGSGHGYCEYPYQDSPEYPSACDDHKYEAVHTFHSVLFACTIFILSTFMVEILLLVVCLGPKLFFSRFLYVLDLFVISSSLALELMFATLDDAATADIAGLLVVFRLWRFVRIGHGLVASTHEMAEHKMNALKKYTRQLEDEVIEGGGVLPESRWSLGLLGAAGAEAGGKNSGASSRTFNVAVGGKVVSSLNVTEGVELSSKNLMKNIGRRDTSSTNILDSIPSGDEDDEEGPAFHTNTSARV